MSDKYGRKKIVYMGMIAYLVFFGGILISPNIWVACAFTAFAGFSNALLDTGTYPALAECYPDSVGSMSVLNKAFISVGQFILPVIVSTLLLWHMHYSISFLICLAVVIANLIFIRSCKFPPLSVPDQNQKVIDTSTSELTGKPIFWIEGFALILFGFTSVSTFNIIVVWLPQYAQYIAGMEATNSLMLVSIYSIGSLMSVFATSYLVKKYLKPITVMVVCAFVSLLIMVFVSVYPTPIGCTIAAFGIGVFASGGIWQLALTLLLEFFPTYKGRITSYYTFLTSVSVMIIPLITGRLSEINLSYIMYFNVFITGLGVLLALVTRFRYYQLKSSV